MSTTFSTSLVTLAAISSTGHSAKLFAEHKRQQTLKLWIDDCSQYPNNIRKSLGSDKAASVLADLVQQDIANSLGVSEDKIQDVFNNRFTNGQLCHMRAWNTNFNFNIVGENEAETEALIAKYKQMVSEKTIDMTGTEAFLEDEPYMAHTLGKSTLDEFSSKVKLGKCRYEWCPYMCGPRTYRCRKAFQKGWGVACKRKCMEKECMPECEKDFAGPTIACGPRPGKASGNDKQHFDLRDIMPAEFTHGITQIVETDAGFIPIDKGDHVYDVALCTPITPGKCPIAAFISVHEAETKAYCAAQSPAQVGSWTYCPDTGAAEAIFTDPRFFRDELRKTRVRISCGPTAELKPTGEKFLAQTIGDTIWRYMNLTSSVMCKK